MCSADQAENEDDRNESIRMKCSGKSAAAGGHEGREKNSRGGERLEQRVRRATALSAIMGDWSWIVADKGQRPSAVRVSNPKRNQNTL